MSTRAIFHIHHIPAGPMRQAAATARLLEDEPAQLLEDLAVVMRQAVSGIKLAQEVNDAISAARRAPEASHWLGRLRPHVSEQTPYWLRAWMGEGPAAHALPALGRLHDYGNIYASSAAYHEHWRGIIRWRDVDGVVHQHRTPPNSIRAYTLLCTTMRQLLFHDDPSFLAKVLSDAPVFPHEVVEVAARRPTRASLQEVIAQSKWIEHDAVRFALCANPYSPLHLILSLTPMLSGAQLRSLAEDEHQSAHVRALARGLWCEQHRGVQALWREANETLAMAEATR